MRLSDVGFGGHVVGNAFHLSLLYKVNRIRNCGGNYLYTKTKTDAISYFSCCGNSAVKYLEHNRKSKAVVGFQRHTSSRASHPST